MASLEHITDAIRRLTRFISPLLPLASCHMVDYISADHWENLLPKQIRDDLWHLSKEELHQLPSASLYPDLDDDTSINSWNMSSSNLASYVSTIRQHSLASLGVTTPIEEVLEIHGPLEVATLPMKGIMSEKKTHEVETMSGVVSRLAKGYGIDWIIDLGSGKGYLSTSLMLQYSLNVVAIDSSQENTSSALIRKSKMQKYWRSIQKTEEDRRLGRPVKKGKVRRKKIAPLEDHRNADQTDKALPQSEINAVRLIPITAFITEDTDLLQVVKDNVEKETNISKDCSDECSSNTDDTCQKCSVKFSGKMSESENDCDFSSRDNSSSVEVLPGERTEKYDFFIGTSNDSKLGENIMPNNSSLGKNTTCTHDNSNLEGNTTCSHDNSILGENTMSNKSSLEENTAHTSTSNDSNSKKNAAFSNTNLGENTMSNFPQIHDDSKLGLVGLHTCGNLAPSSLKLFLSNESVSFICNVGCCYHLMEEEFSRNPFMDYSAINLNKVPEPVKPKVSGIVHSHENSEGSENINPMHPSKIPNLTLGFPLSKILRDEKFALGRNARMLSCQPADRLNCKDLSSTMALYWRSLLQIVLLQTIGNISDMAHVGRIAAKCQNFTEYARAAFVKLGIDIEIADEELKAYDEKYGSHIKKLEKFFLFRASLAPVIEGLILLDRLAFLYEQGIESAYLVQLFDPVTSPRCHALIAFRNRSS